MVKNTFDTLTRRLGGAAAFTNSPPEPDAPIEPTVIPVNRYIKSTANTKNENESSIVTMMVLDGEGEPEAECEDGDISLTVTPSFLNHSQHDQDNSDEDEEEMEQFRSPGRKDSRKKTTAGAQLYTRSNNSQTLLATEAHREASKLAASSLVYSPAPIAIVTNTTPTPEKKLSSNGGEGEGAEKTDKEDKEVITETSKFLTLNGIYGWTNRARRVKAREERLQSPPRASPSQEEKEVDDEQAGDVSLSKEEIRDLATGRGEAWWRSGGGEGGDTEEEAAKKKEKGKVEKEKEKEKGQLKEGSTGGTKLWGILSRKARALGAFASGAKTSKADAAGTSGTTVSTANSTTPTSKKAKSKSRRSKPSLGFPRASRARSTSTSSSSSASSTSDYEGTLIELTPRQALEIQADIQNLRAEILNVKTESATVATRAAAKIVETTQVAEKGMVMLADQNERIGRVARGLDRVEACADMADRQADELKRLNRFFMIPVIGSRLTKSDRQLRREETQKKKLEAELDTESRLTRQRLEQVGITLPSSTPPASTSYSLKSSSPTRGSGSVPNTIPSTSAMTLLNDSPLAQEPISIISGDATADKDEEALDASIDASLDLISNSLGRLKCMSLAMGEEIQTQNRRMAMLGDVSERTGEAIKRVNRGLEGIMKS